MGYRDDVREVKRLSRLIDRADADADAWKWERADLIAALCEMRKQTEVSADIGISQGTVSIMVRLVRYYPGNTERPVYTEAYFHIKGANARPGFGDSLRTLPEKVASAQKLLADPAVREATLRDRKTRHAVTQTAADVQDEIPHPSYKPARESSSEIDNGAALVDLADMAKYAKRANENADYSALTPKDQRDAEIFIRATEAEIAVWREQAGGGISDEALRRLTEGV